MLQHGSRMPHGTQSSPANRVALGEKEKLPVLAKSRMSPLCPHVDGLHFPLAAFTARWSLVPLASGVCNTPAFPTSSGALVALPVRMKKFSLPSSTTNRGLGEHLTLTTQTSPLPGRNVEAASCRFPASGCESGVSPLSSSGKMPLLQFSCSFHAP